MDLRAFYSQAAEAAATVAAVRTADGDAPRLTPKAVLLQFEVQGVGLGGADEGAAVPRHGSGGAAPVVGMEGEGGGGGGGGGGAARDLTCPECGKAFLSDKAMYGHLRCHPERGYKGATRPATSSAAASVAGDTKPRKVPRKEAELSAKKSPADRKPRKVAWKEGEISTKWPVTARRGRTPTTAANSLMSTAPVSVLKSTCSEEEEAAMTLLEMSSRGATPEPEELPAPQMRVRHAVAVHQLMPGAEQLEIPDHVADDVAVHQLMPGAEQLVLPDHVTDDVVVHLVPEVEQSVIPDHDAAGAVTLQPVLKAEKPVVPVEHILEIVMKPQAPEVEQALLLPAHVAEVTAASEMKMPTKPEPVTEAVLVMVRGKKVPAGNGKHVVSPGTKKPKKRRLHDLDQTPDPQPPAAEAAAAKPPARRIPSPGSDRTYGCLTCHKTFPTHQALGGHMASHNRVSKYAGAQQHVDGLSMAHAVHNILPHHQAVAAAVGLGEDPLDILPPPPVVPQGPPQHPCTRCHLIFPTGQALGGHMRKHWLPDKQQAAATAAAAAEPSGGAPWDFDLNELPRE